MGGHPEEPPRRGFRFPAGVQAELHDDSGSFLCAAENLSRSGVLLVGPLPPPAGGRVDLTLKDRGGRHEARLTGRVIRLATDEDTKDLQIAVEFDELDAARRDDLEVLLARLLEGGPVPTSLDELRPGSSPLEVKKALDAIPLPQRINMAGRAGPKEREYLRQDAHPAVLDALARNPSLVLAEARALAASAFLTAPTIDFLAADPRYKSDEEIVFALAVHPRVSLATATRLTSQLKPPQLRKLTAKPGLSGALRDQLFKRITRG